MFALFINYRILTVKVVKPLCFISDVVTFYYGFV